MAAKHLIALGVLGGGLLVLAGCGEPDDGSADNDAAQDSSPYAVVEQVRNDDPWVGGGVVYDESQRPIPVTGGPAAGFVPDSECAVCHQRIAADFGRKGMGMSAYPPTLDNLIEDFENNHFYHAPSDRHYQMTIRDGEIFQRRYQVDYDGLEYNVVERKVDFIVGSGTNSRSYLYRTATGEMFQLPLVWYTQTQSWGMAPGYDRPLHWGFTRPITRECMFCHNGYPDVPLGSDRATLEQVFPEALPHGIGCQRCHGPGADHVRLAYLLDSTLPEVREAIINPASLEPSLRDDVCLQCHLQPSSEVATRVRVPGRTAYSFRPGQALEEFLVILDFQRVIDGEDRYDINHHPFRLHQSRCFIESDGALSCLTCHDPHRKVPVVQRASYYRDKCLTCHQLEQCDIAAMQLATARDAGHPDSIDCISCHMPRRRTQDVVQIVMTDHLIAKDITPEDERLRPLEERSRSDHIELRAFFGDRDPQGDALAAYIGMSLAKDGQKKSTQVFDAWEAASDQQSEETLYYRALAYALDERAEDAHLVLTELLQRSPNLAAAHRLMAQVQRGLGDLPGSLDEMETAVRLESNSSRAHFGLGLVRFWGGDIPGAIDSLERAAELNPNHSAALSILGRVLTRAGRPDEAVLRYQQAVVVDPGRVDAVLDLALILADLGRLNESAQTLRRALRGKGDDPVLLEGYGAVLAVRGAAAEALEVVERARAQGADTVNCLLTEAIALARLNRSGEARRTYDRSRVLGSTPSSDSSRMIRALLEKTASGTPGLESQ